MSGFTAEWLDLRAPFDRAARSRHLAVSFADALPEKGPVADLGAGTGANLRYLQAMLGEAQPWRLAEKDPALLAQAPAAPHIAHRHCDIDRELEVILAGVVGVTASALLDLVSAPWADRLAQIMARDRLPGLFALTYDGRMAFDPSDPRDSLVVEAFNRHQATDKGFGPALGPDAVRHLRGALRGSGAAIAAERSDWRVPATATAMVAALIEGMVTPATEMAPVHAAAIAAWADRRRAQIAAGVLRLTVGHRDLLVTWD